MQGYNFKTKQTTNLFDTVKYVMFCDSPSNPLRDRVHAEHAPLFVERINGRWTMFFDAECLGNIYIKAHDNAYTGKINGFKHPLHFNLQSKDKDCINDVIYISGGYY